MLLLGLLLVLGCEPGIEPQAAAPKPSAYSLQWDAPVECPSAEEVRSEIRAWLGRDPTGEGTIEVVGRVQRLPAEFELTLDTAFRGHRESRTLRAPHCEELSDATALLVALAIDPETTALVETREREVPPDVGRDPVVESPVEGPPTTGDAADTVPSRVAAARRASAWLGAGVGAEFGALSAATAGVHLEVGAAWRRARLLAHGVYLTPRTVVSREGLGGRYQLGAAGVRGCWLPVAGPTSLPVCAGVEGGALRIDTRGLSPTRRVLGLWLGPLVSVGLERQLGRRWRIWASAQGVLRAHGNAARIDGSRVMVQFPVSFRILVGMSFVGPQ